MPKPRRCVLSKEGPSIISSSNFNQSSGSTAYSSAIVLMETFGSPETCLGLAGFRQFSSFSAGSLCLILKTQLEASNTDGCTPDQEKLCVFLLVQEFDGTIKILKRGDAENGYKIEKAVPWCSQNDQKWFCI